MPRPLLVLLALALGAPALAQERNTDRPGGDYRHFATAAGDGFAVCERACNGEAQCRAWSFVRPARAGEAGHCWLKASVPDPQPNPRVDSGVKAVLRLPTPLPLPRRDPPPRRAEFVRAEVAGVRDAAPGALRPVLTDGALVLRSFELAFPRDDHKVRRLGVLQEGRVARFAFADQDSNDPFDGEATWLSYPDAVAGEVHGTSRGRAVAPIPAGPPGHTLVLRGFQVARADGTDANVRTLGVSLDGDAREATVVLSDDMGPDWRGFEAAAGIATLLGFFAYDPGTALAVSGTDALNRLNGGFAPQQGQVPGRLYAFTVQYAWLPSRYVVAEGAMTGTEATEARFRRERPGDLHALQAFTFAFGNSDHHLGRVAIDLAAAGTYPGSDVWPPPVFFQDRNRDDPMQWAVEYVTLREH